MRYSRLDILNIARELSKQMSERAIINHKKAMQQTINYILHIKSRRLYLRPSYKSKSIKDPLHIKGYVDSNYLTNPEIRKSVSTLEVTLNNVPVVM